MLRRAFSSVACRSIWAPGVVLLGAATVRAEEGAAAPPPPDAEAPSVVIHGERSSGYAVHGQVTGSRAARPVNDVPQGVTVVPTTLLEDTGARRIEDALAITPSVQLGAGFGSLWEDYLVRGSRVWSGTMYRNGYLGGYSNIAATDAVNVERVEVLRGPAAALYGPGLPGGSINVITKRPDRDARFTIGTGLGSFGTARATVDATGPLSDTVAGRLTVAVDSTEGFRDFNESTRWVANPVVAFDLSPQTRLLVETQAFRVRYRPDPGGVPILGGDPFALPTHRSLIPPSTPLTKFDGTLLRTELEHRFAPDLAVRVGVQRQAALSDEYAIYPIGLEPDGRTMDRIPTHMSLSSQDIALQAGLEWKPRTGGIQHDVVIGTDLRYEHVTWRLGTSDPGADAFPIDVYHPDYGAPAPPVLEPPGASNVWTYRDAGLYVNDVVHVLPELRVVAGGRVDSYEQTSVAPAASIDDKKGELAPSGRLGALYDVVDALTVYASVSRGFWPVLGVSADAHLLAPEGSLGFEGGARLALPQDVLTVDLAAFEIDNRNISVPDPAHPDFQVQRGESRSRGLEAFATARPVSMLRLMASYTLADARVTEDPDPKNVDSWLPFVPRHTGGGWVTLTPPVGTGTAEVGTGVRAVGERHLNDHTAIPGYARWDGMIGYRMRPGAVHLFVQNLLGTRYVQSGNDVNSILFGAPRTFLVSVTGTL